jgi:hypothetical protein
MNRLITYASISVFGAIGAWLGALLDHGYWLGAWAILGLTLGSFVGIWVGYKINQNF